MAQTHEMRRAGADVEQLRTALQGDLPDLLTEVSGLLRSEWPSYAQFLDENGPGVAQAATSFVELLVDTARAGLAELEPVPSEAQPAIQVTFEQIGRVHCIRGHELTDLLPAYRLGARAAWRHVSATAVRLGLPTKVLAALGEAVFVFVDQLGSASADGYLQQQLQSGAERERLRRELAGLLLCNRSDTSAVQSAAERAGWPLPAEAALVLVDQSDETARTVVERLGRRCLPVREHTTYGAVVPGPLCTARKDELVRELHGANAVVGQSVPLQDFPASALLPRRALHMRQRGVLDGDPVFVGDHLDSIIVQHDEQVLDALRAQVLDPLAELSPATRIRLTETLRSWLRHMGDRSAVADELFIHPQTVRYRMSQLREYFGEQLDSPRARARMLLALEWAPSD